MFQFGQRVFRPTLIPTIVTLVLLVVMIKLGFWQLERAEEKRNLLQQFESQQKLPPLKLNKFTDGYQLYEYQKVSLKGEFDTQHQFLLDNKVYQGKVGYQVITPLIITGSNKVVLINRGWIPQGGNRSELPEFTTPAGMVEVYGQVKLNPGEGFSLGGDIKKDTSWPRVIQKLDIPLLEGYLGQPLLPLVVLQDPKNEGGFDRDWYIKKIVPEKSTSYAVQWFALSLALLVIYFVVNSRKINVE